MIFLGEVTLSIKQSFTAACLDYMLQLGVLGFFLHWVLLELIIFYIFHCCISSFFIFKTGGFSGFWDRNTCVSPSSLLYIIGVITTIANAICFNLFKLVFSNDKKYLEKTVFHSAIGNLDVIPILGVEIPTYMPIILTILVILNFFDVYAKLLNKCGVHVFVFKKEFKCKYIDMG